MIFATLHVSNIPARACQDRYRAIAHDVKKFNALYLMFKAKTGTSEAQAIGA
jgi:hypothetical protein